MKKKERSIEDVRLESALLKALSVRSSFERHAEQLEYKRLLPNTALLLNDYKQYFDNFKEHTEIDWGAFVTEFGQNWHSKDLDNDDIKYYIDTVVPLINNVKDSDTESVLVGLLDREYKEKINTALNGSINIHELSDIIEEYKKARGEYIQEVDNDVFRLDKINVAVLDASNGVDWFLGSLQAGLGGMMPGQFIVVSADSGTGKSAFCISQAVHSFKQGKKVLYCTSEDTKEDLTGRFMSNLYADKMAAGFDGVIKNWGKIVEHFKKNYNTHNFFGMQIGSPHDLSKIQQKIDTYQPDVIIIDMLDCLSKELGHEALTALYNRIRTIANSGYVIIGTTQSGNTTYYDKESNTYKHRKNLSEKDMAGSKFGKQGAAYCAIMIGKDDDMPDIRYVKTTKKRNVGSMLEQHAS